MQRIPCRGRAGKTPAIEQKEINARRCGGEKGNATVVDGFKGSYRAKTQGIIYTESGELS